MAEERAAAARPAGPDLEGDAARLGVGGADGSSDRAYRLLALDLDGTVLTAQGTVSPRVRRAVRRALRAGVRVTLATGRVLPSAWVYARLLGLRGPLVVSDGAVLAEVGVRSSPAGSGAGSGGRGPWAVLDVRPFPRDLAAAVVDDLLAAGCPVVVQFPEFLASSRRPPVGTLVRSLALPFLRHYWVLRRYTRVVPGRRLARFVAVAPQPPVKISALGLAEALRPLEQRIRDRYGEALRLTHSGPGSFDLLPPGTHKAAGLARLAARLGLAREQVVAVGDNDNDCEMLRWAGLGVAMGNAAPEVRRCADWVTDPNWQDGVARLIDEVLLAGGDPARAGGPRSP
ncbi:MAG TPA: HAD hydrolase family protein [Thermaerobacter sp.]